MKIVGFAGSNSRTSINKKLVGYALSLFEQCEVELLDLNDYEVDIYSPERESEFGIPEKITALAAKISRADLLVLSLAEHNSSYSAAFKNIYDWISRIPKRKVFDGSAMLLMASSPGGRGGAGVLAAAQERFPRDGAEIWETFSLPNFYDNFDEEKVEISTVSFRLELIRKINHVMYDKLGIISKDYKGCGINRSKNDCGDASDC